MNTETTTNIKVRTLGRFSVSYKDTIIAGGSSYSESQFVYLLQILLHAGRKGVNRTALEEALFETRDISNIRHATQSVIYNAKKKLRQLGLPDVNYIENRGGIFYWNDSIPVEEDARLFEEACRKAEQCEVLEEKLALSLNACYMYTGEFLGLYTGILWAAQEARRYHAMFCSIVESTTDMLRTLQDYSEMESLGRYAAGADPLANWEVITMEALAGLGRYDEALKFYDDTASYYMQEQGLKPSGKMITMLNGLSASLQHTHEVLDKIQDHLSGRASCTTGGYFCSYPVFQGIYRMIERMVERGGQSIYLMLCTIVDGKGNPMREGDVLNELSERLREAITESIRHSDCVTRYGKGQYLVLLMNTTLENCAIVQKRINFRFILKRQRSGVQYYVNSVISPYG